MRKRKKLSLAACGGLGALAAAVLTAALCVPAAILIHRQVLPAETGRTLVQIIAGVSMAVSACIAAALRGRQALLTAGLAAAGVLLAAILAGLLLGTGEGMTAWLPRLACCLFFGAAAGAVMSLRRNPQKKRRR